MDYFRNTQKLEPCSNRNWKCQAARLGFRYLDSQN